MRKRRLAILGFGKVGKACSELVLSSQEWAMSGIIRRAENVRQPLPDSLKGVPVVSHVSELEGVEGVLVCVPPDVVREIAHEVLQHKIPLVECAILHGEPFRAHKEAIRRVAVHHKVAAIVGAGWDPGAVSLFRGLLALVIPTGQTKTIHRSGKNLHHTLTVESVSGVRNALCTELRTAEGKFQRYVYVELEEGADRDRVIEAIQTDPLFLKEETFVFPVECIEALEEQGRGIVLERRGSSGRMAHQHVLLEARYDVVTLTAQVMFAAARALPILNPGAHSLFDIPFGAIWSDQIEKEWI